MARDAFERIRPVNRAGAVVSESARDAPSVTDVFFAVGCFLGVSLSENYVNNPAYGDFHRS
jgi:hypothetical protein